MGERPPGDAPLYLKVAAGLTTGALAIAIASPTDLVKVPKHRHTNTSQAGAITTCHALQSLSAAVTIDFVYCKGLGETAMLTLFHVLVIGRAQSIP